MTGIGLLQAVDLLVGVVVIAAGLASMRFGRVGWLMLLVGATWLVGSVFAAAVFLHRGPLVHLHLTYPTGHSRRRYVTVVIAAAYVLGVVEFARDRILDVVDQFEDIPARHDTTRGHRHTAGLFNDRAHLIEGFKNSVHGDTFPGVVSVTSVPFVTPVTRQPLQVCRRAGTLTPCTRFCAAARPV